MMSHQIKCFLKSLNNEKKKKKKKKNTKHVQI